MKKTLIVVISFFLLTVINQLSAEYILFKKSDNTPAFTVMPIADADYEIIYKSILMKYQWPMSIAASLSEKNIMSFSLPVPYPLEEEFIRKKVQEINPLYDVAFVPTTMYELFTTELVIEDPSDNISDSDDENPPKLIIKPAFTSCINTVAETFFNSKDEKRNLDYMIIDILEQDNSEGYSTHLTNQSLSNVKNEASLKKIYELFNQINSQQCMIELQKKINDYLLGILASQNLLKIIDFKVWIDDSAKITQQLINPLFLRNLNLKKLYFYELVMHRQNLAILYRGVEPLIFSTFFGKYILPLEYSVNLTAYQTDYVFKEIDLALFNAYADLLQKSKKNILNKIEEAQLKKITAQINKNYRYFDWFVPLRSVSFGNSLMAGFVHDSGTAGATVGDFIGQKPIIGYGLSINKYRYLKGDLQNLFRISPLSVAIGLLCAHGELFHSRSMSFYHKKMNANSYEDIPGIDLPIKQDTIGYILQQGNPLYRALQLSEYIERNAVLLKLPEQNGGWEFKEKDAQLYMNDQHNLSAVLKILNALQDYAEAKKALPNIKKRKRELEPYEPEKIRKLNN